MIEAKYLDNKRLVEITADIDFKNFSGLTAKDKLDWSLNTSWNSAKTSLTGKKSCKVEKTGYHYDPKVKCGPLSDKTIRSTQSARVINNLCLNKNGEQVSPNTYECSQENTKLCERGDLSGKFGQLKVKSKMPTFKKFVDDNFVSKKEAKDPNYDFSFVLTKGDKRILCAKAVFSCSSI